jgi:hypothetical protein
MLRGQAKLIVRSVKNWLLLLRRNWQFALIGLAAGSLAWQMVARYAPKRYTGSALITLNLSLLSLDSQTGSAEQNSQSAMTAHLKESASRVDWNAIVRQYEPYPELLSSSGSARVAAYLASRVSVEPVAATEMGGNVIRIRYTGDNRDVVAGIVGDVADAFVRPSLRLNTAPATPAALPLDLPIVVPPSQAPVAEARQPANRRTRLRERRWVRRHGKMEAPAAKFAAQPTIGAPALTATAARSASAVDHALQVSLADGVKLQDALTQSSLSVTNLRAQADEQQKRVQAPPAPAKSPERKLTPQEERLRQDLARAQRELAVLRDRYTDQYPDVVAATERVQGLLLDMSRIAADRPSTPPAENRQQAAQDLGILLQQLNDAVALQSRLQAAVDHNRDESDRLRAQLSAAQSKTRTDLTAADSSDRALPEAPPVATPASTLVTPDPMLASQAAAEGNGGMVSPFFLVQQPEVVTQPLIFATQFLWPLSLVFGMLAAVLAAWLAEQRDPSIRNEVMLRRELPASAVYLGGVPRIRHEVIAD